MMSGRTERQVEKQQPLFDASTRVDDGCFIFRERTLGWSLRHRNKNREERTSARGKKQGGI